METMINNVKRKKRRTRRCLDELRKRAHNFSCKNESKDNKINTKSSTINASGFNKQCITIHRLTLFPRAIKSETITRPILDKKHGKSLLQTKISPSNVSKLIGIEPVYVINDCNSEAIHKNSSYEIDSGRRDLSKYSNGSSQSSINMFSPIIASEKNNDQSSSLSNVASPRSHDDCGYQLYEEFIDEVPMYLEHNAPSILNEDVMSETRSYLQNLYMEESPTRSYSPQNSILRLSSDNTINSSPDTILQNPKDYLRHRLICRPANSSTSNDSLPQTDGNPYSKQPLSSPRFPVNGQTLSIIHITPEYNFYPHKLN